MNTTIEFEIKARVEDGNALNELLGGSGRLPVRQSHQVDSYYDTSDRKLYASGAFLRIRNGKLLQLKTAPATAGDVHLWCEEIETRLDGAAPDFFGIASRLQPFLQPIKPQCDTLQDLLSSFSLFPFVEIGKNRAIYEVDGAEVALDTLDNLGSFVEIEVTKPEMRQHFLDLSERLGLKQLPVGYVELALRQSEPETYSRGRYRLLEDVAKQAIP